MKGEPLLEKIRGAELLGLCLNIFGADAGQDDDRCLLIEGTNFLQHFKAAYVRQFQIENGQPWAILSKSSEAVSSIRRSDDFMAAAGKNGVQEIAD